MVDEMLCRHLIWTVLLAVGCRSGGEVKKKVHGGLKPFPTRELEVTFHSGEVRLAGTLVLPEARGPFPAIVVVHGSGPSDRHSWEQHTRHFPSCGVALLRFDKRGVGGSTGDWRPAAMATLASDVLAGVDFLRGRPEIRGDAIGLWGGSQGWVVASLAATRGPERVAFAIIASGAPGGLWEQEKHRVRQTLAAEGADDETRRRVDELLAAMEAFFRSGEGYDKLRSMGEDPRFKPLLPHVIKGGVVPPEDHPAVLYWRRNASYDPVATLKRVRCPVLAIWGEKDFLVDAARAAQLARGALAAAGHPDYTVRVLPSADHGLYLRREPGVGWAKDRTRFVPGFIELTTRWALERIQRRAR
jgi:pimeloyl-ACP methyl ester carboxylesterase